MSLKTGIWALRLRFKGGGEVGEGEEGEGVAAAQKGIDGPTDQPIEQGVAMILQGESP